MTIGGNYLETMGTQNKHKITDLLWTQAERSRQIMILGAVLFFTIVMSSGVVTLVRAGTDNTNFSLTVATGALTITAPTQLNFNQGTSTAGGTALMNQYNTVANAVTANDITGTGDGWPLSGYWNAVWTSAGAATMAIIDRGTLRAAWQAADIKVNNNTGVDGDVQAGTTGAFSGTLSGNARTLADADAGNGQGAFDIYNLNVTYNIPIAATATNYTTEFIFSIV